MELIPEGQGVAGSQTCCRCVCVRVYVFFPRQVCGLLPAGSSLKRRYSMDLVVTSGF